ncbi:cytosolic phospholipase A2 gamma-like isoform X2 [Lissotriton helveticus]
METKKKGTSHIRWSKELSDGEKAATEQRKKVVAECLRRNSIKCDVDKVPCVALLGSGGGIRAMIALMGTLSELGSEDLLDSITYLCGVSGSTWCMSSVYEDINWSKNVKKCESKLIDYIKKPSRNRLSVWEKIENAHEQGVCSLTTLWSYLIGKYMIKEINENNLSKQKEACENGANPYPIYAAVEKSNIINEKKNASGTWFEFTPHDSGFPDYGAFVNTEVIGSQFKKGNIANVESETTIRYLRGLWGSALADEHEIKTYIKEHILHWFSGKHEEDVEKDYEEEETTGLQSCPVPVECTCERCKNSEFISTLSAEELAGEVGHKALLKLEEELKKAPMKCSRECFEAAEYIMTLSAKELASEAGQKALQRLEELLEEYKKNETPQTTTSQTSDEKGEGEYVSLGSVFPSILSSAYGKMVTMAKLMKSLVSWQWGTTHNYLYKCNTTENPIPKEVAERKFINLIDAGLAINSGYPLVLRPERKVDLILSFDCSSGDPFETLKLTAEYCKVHNIPFPAIHVHKDDEETPSGFYIFKGSKVPTVVHIPLFNTENCAGEVEKYRDTFSTFKPSYDKDEIEDLLKVSKQNVQNNKSKILKQLAEAVLA